jgi:hypothetical protein
MDRLPVVRRASTVPGFVNPIKLTSRATDSPARFPFLITIINESHVNVNYYLCRDIQVVFVELEASSELPFHSKGRSSEPFGHFLDSLDQRILGRSCC